VPFLTLSGQPSDATHVRRQVLAGQGRTDVLVVDVVTMVRAEVERELATGSTDGDGQGRAQRTGRGGVGLVAPMKLEQGT
jgi:hypothetical protein